mmetsp:Transcript_34823/g.64413  ORF Transcript_34823/g.64413 Transcript_34823/m.64413 type:complete len:339 (-) Transcript_34823:1799-2815(-)
MVILMMVAVGSVSATSTLLISTSAASSSAPLMVISHISTSSTSSPAWSATWASTRLFFIVRLVSLVRWGTITTTTHTLPSHEALVGVAKLVSSLRGSERLLAVACMAVLHAIGRMTHLRKLACIHVGRIRILHGRHSWGHATASIGVVVVAWGSWSSSRSIIAWGCCSRVGSRGRGRGGWLHPIRNLLLLLLLLGALVELGPSVILLSAGLRWLLVGGTTEGKLTRWHATETIRNSWWRMNVVHAHSAILRHAGGVHHLTSQLVHSIEGLWLRRRRLGRGRGGRCLLGYDGRTCVHHLRTTKRSVFKLVLKLVDKHRISRHGRHREAGRGTRGGGSMG